MLLREKSKPLPFATIGSFTVKFQYSLRTLIIACFIAGLVLYIAVGFHVNRVEHEVALRCRELSYTVGEIYIRKMEDGVKQTPIVSYDRTGTSRLWTNKDGYFVFFVKFIADEELTPVPAKSIGTPIYSLRISCGRTAVAVKPIEIDYDDAVENETLVAALKKLCEDHHWPYVARKVDRIQNDKSQMPTDK